jgi:hypothetical protein
MPPQYEHDHIEHCHGNVRQCKTCGGRMCDCGSEGLPYQIFRCIHGGEIKVDEREQESGSRLNPIYQR